MGFYRAEVNFADGLSGNSLYIRLVFSGCAKASGGNPCLNCHNPGLWPFEHISDDEAFRRMKLFKQQINEWCDDRIRFDGVSVIGGEPLDQEYGLSSAALDYVRARYPGIPLFTYSGLSEEQFFRGVNKDGVPYREHPFAYRARYLKLGPYIEELKTPENKQGGLQLGSLNQNVYELTVEAPGRIRYNKVNIGINSTV